MALPVASDHAAGCGGLHGDRLMAVLAADFRAGVDGFAARGEAGDMMLPFPATPPPFNFCAGADASAAQLSACAAAHAGTN